MPTISFLRKKYFPTFQKSLDFDLLLANALHRPTEFLYAHSEYSPTPTERSRFVRLVRLYQAGYSIAAITHHKEFYGLDFYVNKNVLIPRPETELLVEAAINVASSPARGEVRRGGSNHQQTLLIDIGTGSGCIPISILKKLQPQRIKTFAIDISKPALHVAKKNARTHNVPITFLQGNLLTPLTTHPSYKLTANSYNLIITANLPYLTAAQFKAEPSIQKEPRLALVAKNNGLELYKKLLKQISQLLLSIDCCLFTCLLEIDPSQTARVQKLIKTYLPSASTTITKDLAGLDRVVTIKVKQRLSS